MFPHYFIVSLFAFTGCLSVLASVCNWEWFFHSQNAQWILRYLGAKWTRVFYGIVGIGLLGTALWLLKTTGFGATP